MRTSNITILKNIDIGNSTIALQYTQLLLLFVCNGIQVRTSQVSVESVLFETVVLRMHGAVTWTESMLTISETGERAI